MTREQYEALTTALINFVIRTCENPASNVAVQTLPVAVKAIAMLEGMMRQL